MFVTSGDGAAFFIGGIFGPGAITGAGVEDQLSGASEVVLLAFDAREHHVAAGRVGMLEHAVPARAVTDRPGGLQLFTTVAVDQTGQIAFVLGFFEWIED